MDVRTYPVNLVPDPALFPRDLFDPRWKAPETRQRVAAHFISKLLNAPAAALQADLGLLAGWSEGHLTRDRLVLAPGGGARGSAVNELHRRYAFGSGQPTLNFHAQVVVGGVDAAGHACLRAQIGRFGASAEHRVLVAARLFAGARALGGLVWQGPVGDDRVVALRSTQPLAVAPDAVELIFGADPRAPESQKKARGTDAAVLEALSWLGD